MKTTMTLSAGLMSLVVFSTGCGQASAPPPTAAAPDHDHPAQPALAHQHDESGWWCTEHGVPEHLCGLCDSKLAAEFQKKGDWCKEHDRPDSQCFVCHPEYAARFAAQYEAKFGKQPPKPEG
jgi:cobalt-zinc-cadmium efflux system membrane fusion protein